MLLVLLSDTVLEQIYAKIDVVSVKNEIIPIWTTNMQLCLSKTNIKSKSCLKQCLFIYLTFGLILASPPLALAAEPNVIVTIDKKSKRWKVQATMQIQVTPAAFIELLDSGPTNCEWMHNCKSVKLLAKPNKNTRHIQTLINSPWPFDDRLMITQSKIEYSKNRSEVTVRIEPLTPNKEQEGLNNTVIINNPRGVWKLLKQDKTYQLSYVGSADADNKIPLFILKRTLMTSTRKTFENIYNKVNKQSNEPSYAQD